MRNFCLGYFYEMHSEYPESEKIVLWYLKVEVIKEMGNQRWLWLITMVKELELLKMKRSLLKLIKKQPILEKEKRFYYLGVCYLEGKGVLQDKEKGIAGLIKNRRSVSCCSLFNRTVF